MPTVKFHSNSSKLSLVNGGPYYLMVSHGKVCDCLLATYQEAFYQWRVEMKRLLAWCSLPVIFANMSRRKVVLCWSCKVLCWCCSVW